MDEQKTTMIFDTLGEISDPAQGLKYIKTNISSTPDMTLKVFFDNYLSSHQELSLAQIIRDSGLSRTYAHEIINGKKKAGRDRVIALCFAASMSIDETNHALILSQNNPLYPKISRDAVLTMCLQFKHQRNVSFQTITQVNLFLEENGHELLVLSKEY